MRTLPPEEPERALAARFDSPEQEAFLNLWRTYDRLKALEDELFGAWDLSAQQYNALRLLRAAHPGAMPTLRLAARLISRSPDITRLLDKLERRGLLRRTRRADNRRVIDVRITDAGLKLLDELDEPVKRCHQQQLGHLDPASIRALVRLLKAARQPHEDTSSLSWVDTAKPGGKHSSSARRAQHNGQTINKSGKQ